MKNIANCTPTEFLKQSVLIADSVEKWLNATDIMNIRKCLPALEDGISKEEKQKRLKKQAKVNLKKMFNAIAVEHPEETVELLALCCFISPEKANEHPMTYYLGAIAEIINDENVIRFFTSLASLGHSMSKMPFSAQ